MAKKPPPPDTAPTAEPADLPGQPGVIDVNPALAAGWLLRNTRNRSLRGAAVDAMARDMHNGRWIYDGAPIRFSADGTLLDGQHRLAAIIESGTTIPLMVIPGLADDAQDVMDTGTRRTIADALHLRGNSRGASPLLASTARLAILIDTGKIAGKNVRVTTQEVIAWLEKNPDAADHVRWVQSHSRQLDISPTVVAWCRWRLSRVDGIEAASFFDDIAGNVTTGRGDPVGAVVRRFAMARRMREKLSPEMQVSMLVRAWNARRRGAELERLQATSRQGRIQIGEPV